MILLTAAIIFSCNKPEPEENVLQDSADCLLIKITDSARITDTINLTYNNSRKLIRYRTWPGASGNSGYTDTFHYDNNGILIQSAYSGGQFITPNKRRTDYLYSNGILIRSNYISVYSSGSESLNSYSDYTFDSSKRLIQVKQVGVSAYTNTHTTRYVYDNNDNLLKIYKKENNGSAEYLSTEFLDFDSYLNPFYKLPWEFDYDLFEYNSDKLSKHNYRRVRTYVGYIVIGGVLQTRLSGDLSYTYTYDSFKKVIKRQAINNANPGNQISVTQYFSYTSCQ